MFSQTWNVLENIYWDVGGYDMYYDENKQLCKKSWEDDYSYLRNDRSMKKPKKIV